MDKESRKKFSAGCRGHVGIEYEFQKYQILRERYQELLWGRDRPGRAGDIGSGREGARAYTGGGLRGYRRGLGYDPRAPGRDRKTLIPRPYRRIGLAWR